MRRGEDVKMGKGAGVKMGRGEWERMCLVLK